MLKRIIATMLVLVTVIGLLPVLPVSMEAEAATSGVVLFWPVNATSDNFSKYITSGYGARGSGTHNGIDISYTGINKTPIYAAYDGEVVRAQVGYNDSYGNLVVIYHPEISVYTIYAHCDSILTSTGKKVNAGDKIATVGNTGNSSGPHLHFGICKRVATGVWPRDYVDSTPGKVYEYTRNSASVGSNTGSSTITTVSITAGNYQIKNKSTGTSLTVVDSKDANSQNIGVAKYTAASGQKHYIYSYNGSYGIRPQCSSSSQRVVNVSTPETVSSGCNVMLWARTNHSSQLWKFEKLSTGEYVIRSTNNMSCVLTAKSGNVCVQTYTGADTQKWTLTSLDTKYTVSYDANGGSSPPSAQTKTHDTALTLSSTVPVRTGYKFVSWNTAADGSGTSYSAGGKYTANANATLYAQWEADSYYLDINGNVNDTVTSNIIGVGTADVYVDGVKVGSSVADFYTRYPKGSTYTINNITAKLGYEYIGAASITGTIEKYTGIYLKFKEANYYLDLNAKVNGTNQGNISGIGSADVYVNGVKVANDVTDFYKLVPNGSSYKITDIRAKDGYTYTGTAAITGTVSGKNTGVYLSYADSHYYLDINAKVNGVVRGNISGIGTADVYVNGVKVGTGVTDFYKLVPAGAKYTITNIKAKTGYTYTGPASVTGTMGWKNTGAYLTFATARYTIKYNANGGSGAPSSQTKTHGAVLTLSSTKPTRAGYTFTGWNTKQNGSGTSYYAGVKFYANANVTLYAQWKENTNYYLDMNAKVNGTVQGNISGIGSADVYVNGVKVGTGVTDFYKLVPAGAKYTITNIKAKNGYTYVGPASVTGTMGWKNTGVYLEFKG